MRTPRLSEPEACLLQPPEPARFGAAELAGLPEPVQRHLAQAITPGTALATSARLRMRGHIKVGRWLPFRARQILNPHNGFVWAARAAAIVAGIDARLLVMGALTPADMRVALLADADLVAWTRAMVEAAPERAGPAGGAP